MESQIVVTEKVGALASEDVGFMQGVIQLQSNRQVLHSLVQDTKTGIASATCQVELAGGLLFLSDCDVEIVQRIVEPMQLVVEQPSEEVERRLLLLLAAALNGDVQELLGLVHLLVLLVVVYIDVLQGVGIAAHDADHIEAEGVLVGREADARLAEVLAGHQVLFSVHLEDATAQPLVVGRGFVDVVRVDLLSFAEILKCMLVFLDGNIAI